MLLRLLLPPALLALAGLACTGNNPDAQSPVPLVTAEPDPKADEGGTLDILCNPSTKVMVDGKPAGTTPISGFKVQPGQHDVTFVDEQSGNRTMSVNVAP